MFQNDLFGDEWDVTLKPLLSGSDRVQSYDSRNCNSDGLYERFPHVVTKVTPVS